jgi:amino-acid N-acetyltransferase
MSAPSEARIKKLALDRDILVSVLEVSATRRDAKSYLKTYTGEQPKALVQVPEHQESTAVTNVPEPAHVAILKLRDPQYLDDELLRGVGKTISQLRILGLLSVVVVDCGTEESRKTYEDQAFRICEAIDSFGRPSKLLDNVFSVNHQAQTDPPTFLSDGIRISDVGLLGRCIRQATVPVIPALTGTDITVASRAADANQAILALTKYLIGYQFNADTTHDSKTSPSFQLPRPEKIASVQRVIILDPLGGTPMTGRPGICHRFINLEQEYEGLVRQLMGPDGSPISQQDQAPVSGATHAANLHLARETLAMLPASSSALITTPFAAANTKAPRQTNTVIPEPFDSMVTTRIHQNPLVHNLLTDKPVYSSSLPFQRMMNGAQNHNQNNTASDSTAATLVKRGMPLTIYPDPRKSPWVPPKPGSPRLRLTDNCIDMPRLVHLIEDSFNRKLDVKDYLDRVNESLAGIIIAGEYEGGAILTWELPPEMDRQTAYEEGRLVPYLDKFAVLKSRQGSGGVADVVFNAMVRDCFPEGVCWRSRKDNPVNKWYFERSSGTEKLTDSNWTMFWTTAELDAQRRTLVDYEAVCRGVEPSWADNKHVLD